MNRTSIRFPPKNSDTPGTILIIAVSVASVAAAAVVLDL